MTFKFAYTCSLIFVTSLLFLGPGAFGQSNLSDNGSSAASENVVDHVDPTVMAEVDRMKAEQKARSDESLRNFRSGTQSSDGVTLIVPPSAAIIVAAETEDGELVATEF